MHFIPSLRNEHFRRLEILEVLFSVCLHCGSGLRVGISVEMIVGTAVGRSDPSMDFVAAARRTTLYQGTLVFSTV